jgi:hypothetical protein
LQLLFKLIALLAKNLLRTPRFSPYTSACSVAYAQRQKHEQDKQASAETITLFWQSAK